MFTICLFPGLGNLYEPINLQRKTAFVTQTLSVLRLCHGFIVFDPRPVMKSILKNAPSSILRLLQRGMYFTHFATVHLVLKGGYPLDETKFTSQFSNPGSKQLPSGTVAYLLAILKSRLYWGILLFAIVPILLETLDVNVVFGMLVYFSLFWLFVFRPLVKTSVPGRSLAVDIVAYIFTAVIGTMFAVYVESFWVVNGAGPLLQSRSPSIAIPSFIIFVGMTEEFAKQIIVLLGVVFVRVRGLRVRPVEFMIMGISSGLGFSALENISYVQKGIMNEVVHHLVGAGVVTALSRALYTPFLHTIFAGIAAYGVGLAAQRGGKAWWAALGLWLLAASLHGFYDATISTHVVWALIAVAICYFLFLVLLLGGMRERRTVRTG